MEEDPDPSSLGLNDQFGHSAKVRIGVDGKEITIYPEKAGNQIDLPNGLPGFAVYTHSR